MRPAVVRVEVVPENAVHMDEEGLSPSFFFRYVWGFILCSASYAAITSFCSFLFYPTSWTSRVFTSFTVTYYTSIYPSSRASRQIMRIIKLHLDQDGYTWDVVPQEARDFYWEEFQKHFVWEEAITAMLKMAWEKLCALRYADFTYRMRKSGKKQQSVRSETGGDGAGPSRHIGGSISATETSQLLAEKYSREPTPMEVFTYTHTKDHDCHMFTDIHALGINERQLAELRVHVMRMSGQPGASTSSSDPPPATDRDVSTAQQQPLQSPIDPDTADGTLVTSADTTTHPAGTPPGDTTLDRADEKPYRFDFGPF
ncbi:hypothetical protein JCGZ_23730 [Jatropha curcas]|uniref:Uncharacterized protein n=1 Tax=Jatropha curcas TaxID=180498 RepID=A0A067K0V1_JATCU|nr:hypothetical protein JCGZ_23730 [Jatropha curcas]